MKKSRQVYMRRTIGFLLSMVLLIAAEAQDKDKHIVMERAFTPSSKIRVAILSHQMARISIVPEGTAFRETGLNRYGFINDPDPGSIKPQVTQHKQEFVVKTSAMTIRVNYTTGKIQVTDAKDGKVLLNQVSGSFAKGVTEAVFNAEKEEDWIGFGDQSRTHLYQRGYVADCDVRYKTSTYLPVPFFMSTRGVGVLVNTTYRTIFDMCKTNPDTYNWKNESGVIDYYIFTGKDYKELIDLYTQLTGRPKLPPNWLFGLWFICRDQADDFETATCAYNFRKEEIPCDVIGLEPGWMQNRYDYSTKKQWHSTRFPHLYWFPETRPPSFVPAIKKMGYKLELWLCNNYDLSYEAERQIGNNLSGPAFEGIDKANATPPIFQDENLGGQVFSDTVTKIQEPWFKHLEKFVDQGVDFFKQDAAVQMEFHPDRLWGNGMKDKEMHNLYPLLYSKQMYDGFKAKTNRRPAALTPAGWAGYQAYSAVWTGDTGGELTTLGGVLNNSIVGHSWSTVDMEVSKKEGIHYGYLLPISEICSWAYFKMPWLQGKELTDMHRYYAQLRSRLFPYLYSTAHIASKTGWPVLQPLTLAYPNDKKNREILHQYLLGPALMVGIYKKDIYFPAGEWKDYWTGEMIEGGLQKNINWPEDRGGALYVKEGAIIPMGPMMQYRGEKPMDEMTLYIFPAEKKTSFDLYEDDGVSFEYEKGKFTSTNISAQKVDGVATVQIGAPSGGFEQSVKQRSWQLILHFSGKPSAVAVNGTPLGEGEYSYDAVRKELTIYKIAGPVTVSAKAE